MARMKKIMLFVYSFVALSCASSQNEDMLKKYLEKYSFNYNADCYGEQLPPYDFNDELNASCLNGKIIIFDFWATWCSACHLLSNDLDSLFKETSDLDECQIIAVNHKESAHSDVAVGKARAYWEKKHYVFPMVEGTRAETFANALKAGHPTLIIADNKGIIRGRWDSYTPETVSMLQVAAWAISHDGCKMDKDIMFEKLRQKKWALALYIAEQLPEDEQVFWGKMKAMLRVSDWDALDYIKMHYDAISSDLRGTEEYEDKLWAILCEIVDANALSVDLNLFGIQLYNELEKKFGGYSNDYVVLDYLSRLYYRVGKKDEARACIAKCLQICEENHISRQVVEYFEKVKSQYDNGR